MAKHSASAAYFLDHYQEVTRRASEALRDYLGDPGEEHARALRSTLRKVDASLRLLPKDARKGGQLRDYEKRCRKVLGLTSPIRDLDLLAARLQPLKRDATVSNLARRAAGRRRKLVKDSMKASWRLFELPVPKLGRGDLSGIDAKANEVLIEMDGKIARLLQKVIASESKVEELHSLRKRCKRLRYMIEALPASEPRKKAAEVLRSWQDILGAVRDSDVLIDCFKQDVSSTSVRRLLRAERIRRHAQYAKFQRAYKATLGAAEDRPKGGSAFFRSPTRRAASGKAPAHHQR
jgi:CHAD domain-containing protein